MEGIFQYADEIALNFDTAFHVGVAKANIRIEHDACKSASIANHDTVGACDLRRPGSLRIELYGDGSLTYGGANLFQQQLFKVAFGLGGRHAWTAPT